MLTLRVSGKKDQLQAFMKHFSAQPYYKIMLDEELEMVSVEEEMTTHFEFVSSLLKPKIRKTLIVTLTTNEGKEINIDLLDGQVIQVDDNTTCIYGKNYDIFA
jgi:threonine synthase